MLILIDQGHRIRCLLRLGIKQARQRQQRCIMLYNRTRRGHDHLLLAFLIQNRQGQHRRCTVRDKTLYQQRKGINPTPNTRGRKQIRIISK